MVGLARKRGVAGHFQRELELSQRYAPQSPAEERRLRARLDEFSWQLPRAGYRAPCGQLRQEGLRVNPKRVQRLWREEGLEVPRKQCRKGRLGTSENGSQRCVDTGPNEVGIHVFLHSWFPRLRQQSQKGFLKVVRTHRRAKDGTEWTQ